MSVKQRSMPFGYAMRNGEIIPNQQEADCVRRIFALYLCGLGYKSIVKHLNKQGVTYHADKVWNHNMVKRVLENRRYTGEAGYPSLISAEDFQMAAVQKEGKPYVHQHRPKATQPAYRYKLTPYQLTSKTRRLTHEINRALERTPDSELVRPMIFACAAEKYNGIGVVFDE